TAKSPSPPSNTCARSSPTRACPPSPSGPTTARSPPARPPSPRTTRTPCSRTSARTPSPTGTPRGRTRCSPRPTAASSTRGCACTASTACGWWTAPSSRSCRTSILWRACTWLARRGRILLGRIGVIC
ncbi:hypothetical protein N0V92_013381, partial [Colletotrichum tropicale]